MYKYYLFAFSIRQTKESGIYELWVKVYSKEPETLKKAMVEYSQGKLEHFLGVFVICGAFLVVALLVFLFESLLLLGKKCNAKTNIEAADNDTAQGVFRLLTANDDTCSSYYRRRMSILDEVRFGIPTATPSTSSNIMAAVRPAANAMPLALKSRLRHSPSIDWTFKQSQNNKWLTNSSRCICNDARLQPVSILFTKIWTEYKSIIPKAIDFAIRWHNYIAESI